ncbi:unnamed protein product [Effrenium voratum]|uniref:Ion transport domain-containing protein n=1 Tax=Effrenium voratum TaxID=2562239 RepID=A0AA36J9L1_9DINO|nr:unnamed protein product [Effrenium voratum]
MLSKEHEEELSRLRAENQRLAEENARLTGAPLRQTGQVELPRAEPPRVRTAEEVEVKVDPISKPEELLPGNSQVKLTIFGAGGFPQEAGDFAKVQIRCTVGLQDNKTQWMPLQGAAVGPNMVPDAQTWEAALQSPEIMRFQTDKGNLLEDITVELWAPDRQVPLATATVAPGMRRQKVLFDFGGFLDAEVTVDGNHAMGHAASEDGSKEAPVNKAQKVNLKPNTTARLLKIFKVEDPAAKVVLPRDVYKALKLCRKKTTSFNVSLEVPELEEVLSEIKRIHEIVHKKEEESSKVARPSAVISWSAFLDTLTLVHLSEFSTGQVSLRLFIVQKALLQDDLPTGRAALALVKAYEQVRKPTTHSQRGVLVIEAISTVAIFMSFITTGVSLDYAPNWDGWRWVDTGFALIFVTEVLFKIIILGPRSFCCKRDRIWNWFDLCLSLGAAAEIVWNLSMRSTSTPTRVALTLRVLRLARVSFYMKLIQTPMLQELANIVQGFLVAVPSLFWVLVTLSVVVYVSALAMRATVQRISGGGIETDTCGSGDSYDLNAQLPSGCGDIHDLYGVEYCGSVLGCMFTIFRCMIGDCTTRGGRSLTLVWSQGYGVQFDVFYAFSMVCVIFGMFNIITAIFVEATMNGLKENANEKKYAQAYESNYMTEQLAKLVMMVSKTVQRARAGQDQSSMGTIRRSLSFSDKSDSELDKELFLTEEEFITAIRTSEVRMLLDDLDVIVEPRPGVFEAFNQEEDGTVSMSELVSGLMSFRGELQKVDVLTTKKYMENLMKQVHDLQHTQGQIVTHIQERPATSPQNLPRHESRRLVVAVPRRRKW